jgi:hypothetical protein
VAGLLSAIATWYVWGSLSRSPVLHDEASYLLQARLFANFRWTAAARPLPEFFEQLYVLMSPAMASKYPPGTALALAPGMMLGVPGLMVVLMNGLSGALVFSLARRAGGGLVAALAWMLWAFAYPVLYFHAMYLSEVPSTLCWLAAWWGLVRWYDTGRPAGLTVSAVAVGYCAITRPLTAAALVIAVGATTLAILLKRSRADARMWRVLAQPIVVGTLIVAIGPFWSWRTTGNPRLAPLTLYTKTYIPFDKPGFGVSPADQPAARLPWDQRITGRIYYQVHEQHTLAALPGTAYTRLRMIGRDMFYDWRGALPLFALLALATAPAMAWIALGAFALQFVFYLSYAHVPEWSLYYTEGLPLLALLTALGVVRVFRVAARDTNPEPRIALAAALTFVIALVPALRTAGQVRAQIAGDRTYYDAFMRLMPPAPQRAVVFVRYARQHNDGLSLVRNEPDLAAARVWTVYDRGADNARLLALAPDRVPYVFDEASWTLRPLSR